MDISGALLGHQNIKFALISSCIFLSSIQHHKHNNYVLKNNKNIPGFRDN